MKLKVKQPAQIEKSRTFTTFAGVKPDEDNGILPAVKLLSLGHLRGWQRVTTEENFKEFMASPSLKNGELPCYNSHFGKPMGDLCGKFTNVRIDSDAIVGDLHLDPCAKGMQVTDVMNLFDYIIYHAKNNSPGIGISIEFDEDWSHDSKFIGEYETYKILDVWGAAVTERPASNGSFYATKSRKNYTTHPGDSVMKKCDLTALIGKLQGLITDEMNDDQEIDISEVLEVDPDPTTDPTKAPVDPEANPEVDPAKLEVEPTDEPKDDEPLTYGVLKKFMSKYDAKATVPARKPMVIRPIEAGNSTKASASQYNSFRELVEAEQKATGLTNYYMAYEICVKKYPEIYAKFAKPAEKKG